MAKSKTSGKLYPVLRPIRYKQPGPDYRKRFEPSTNPKEPLLMNFDHLDAAEIALLQRKKIIGRPVSIEQDSPE